MKATDELRAFNRLFTDYQKGFIRFANSYVHDLAIAEDFTVDSLMYYWENKHKLAANTNAPAYILTTIKHKCLNYLQHVQTQQAVIENITNHAQWELSTRITSLQACDPNELFTEEIRTIVEKTLAKLPEKTRQIFLMSRDQEISYKEIANFFGITTKGVEFHMSKAIKELRKALKDYTPILALIFLFSNN